MPEICKVTLCAGRQTDKNKTVRQRTKNRKTKKKRTENKNFPENGFFIPGIFFFQKSSINQQDFFSADTFQLILFS